MMKMEDLKQLYYLRREATECLKSLHELEKCPGTDEIRGIIAERMRRVEEQRDRLEAYIYAIEDHFTRSVFVLRFEHLMNWKQIAARVGGNEGSLRAMTRRYILKHP